MRWGGVGWGGGVPRFDRPRLGCESRLSHQGTAGFSLWFRVPIWVPISEPQPDFAP